MCRTRAAKTVVLLLPALLPLVFLTSGLPAADEPDDDEVAYQTAVARRALRENCLICHSEEMIAGQRLTPAQWKTEVDKMVGWGSPLPKDQAQPLIDFLAREYSDSKPPAPLGRITYAQALDLVRPEAPLTAPTKGDSTRGAGLYKLHCAVCHGPDGQGAELGPNLVEKTVLLRPRDFYEVIENGRHRMPGFQKLLARGDEDDMLAWLRQRRFTLAPAQ